MRENSTEHDGGTRNVVGDGDECNSERSKMTTTNFPEKRPIHGEQRTFPGSSPAWLKYPLTPVSWLGNGGTSSVYGKSFVIFKAPFL